MNEFGFQIIQALVTDINPDEVRHLSMVFNCIKQPYSVCEMR